MGRVRSWRNPQGKGIIARSAIQQVDELVYSSASVPARMEIDVGQTVRVPAVLMDLDPTHCGGKMTLPELGLAAPFSSAGLAELQFVAPRNAELRFSCGTQGLVLAIKSPLDPDS